MENNVQELKPMNIGNILDKTFKLIFNKEFFRIFIVYFTLYFLLITAEKTILYLLKLYNLLDFNIKYLNSDVIFSFISLILFIIPYSIYCCYSIDLFNHKLKNIPWENEIRKNNIKKNILKIILSLSIILLSNFIINYIIQLLTDSNILSLRDNLLITSILILPMLFIRFLTAFFIVPVITLYLPILIIEKEGIIFSIKRSNFLLSKNYYRIMGAIILLFIIMSAIIFIIDIPKEILASGDFGIKISENILNNIFYLINKTVGFVFTAPILAFITLLYFNQRIKHENLAVELLADKFINEKKDN